ncbi:MAG: hypothetical protein ABI670_17860 [Chloroflexota bacterium]
MLIEQTTIVDQPLVKEIPNMDGPLTDPARPADPSMRGDVLRDAAPANELVSRQSMRVHQLGLSAAMRHGVAPDVSGVLAVTPDVRVPLRSLGLVAPDENRVEAEERRGLTEIDLGAQVGVMLALEYTAGSRSHRLSNGTFSYVRPFHEASTSR